MNTRRFYLFLTLSFLQSTFGNEGGVRLNEVDMDAVRRLIEEDSGVIEKIELDELKAKLTLCVDENKLLRRKVRFLERQIMKMLESVEGSQEEQQPSEEEAPKEDSEVKSDDDNDDTLGYLHYTKKRFEL